MNKKTQSSPYYIVMLLLCFIGSSFLISENMILFNFNANSDLSNWIVVNDVVMGGRSEATFSLNTEGNAVFEGNVSLKNNGGFSSLRYRFEKTEIARYDRIVLHLKGDGKKYQFRVKASSWDRHSYTHEFQTSEAWQKVEIPLSEMMPQFRGRQLAMPKFPGEKLEEIALLIGNKKEEGFKLEIDSIEFQ